MANPDSSVDSLALLRKQMVEALLTSSGRSSPRRCSG